MASTTTNDDDDNDDDDDEQSFDLGCDEDDEAANYPLRSTVGLLDGIAVFLHDDDDDDDDQQQQPQQQQQPIDAADAAFLKSLSNLPAPNGAADMTTYPFFATARTRTPLRTARDILDALRPKHLTGNQQQHVDMTATGGDLKCIVTGQDCFEYIDEIHNDFDHQQFFPTDRDIREEWVNDHYFDNVTDDPLLVAQYQSGTFPAPLNHQPPTVPAAAAAAAVDPAVAATLSFGVHGQLRSYVRDNRI